MKASKLNVVTMARNGDVITIAKRVDGLGRAVEMASYSRAGMYLYPFVIRDKDLIVFSLWPFIKTRSLKAVARRFKRVLVNRPELAGADAITFIKAAYPAVDDEGGDE